MKVLIYSKDFYPSCGGVEDVTFMTCNELTKLGCDVTLITNTPGEANNHYGFKLIRTPSFFLVIKEYIKCDVFIHEVLSLRMLYPLLFGKKKWVCVHHQVDLPNNFKTRLKKIAMRLCHNVAVSKTTAVGYGLKKYKVIYNAYNPNVFYNTNNDMSKRTDFVYIGRLHPDKGLDMLINAYVRLKRDTNMSWKLNIIGGGDCLYVEGLKKKVANWGCKDDVVFYGLKSHEEAAVIINRCRVGIVPSTYREAFGLTVLQLIACGCLVIGSDGDGISEVLGGTGLLFKKKSEEDLYSAMLRAVNMDDSTYTEYCKAERERVSIFIPQMLGVNYFSFLKSIVEEDGATTD